MAAPLLPSPQDFQKRVFHQSLLQIDVPLHLDFLDDIMYFVGSKNYTWVFMAGTKKHLCCRTINFYDKHLLSRSELFVRPHKQYIINTKHVIAIKPDFILMKDGHQVPIARRRRTEVTNIISNVSL